MPKRTPRREPLVRAEHLNAKGASLPRVDRWEAAVARRDTGYSLARTHAAAHLRRAAWRRCVITCMALGYTRAESVEIVVARLQEYGRDVTARHVARALVEVDDHGPLTAWLGNEAVSFYWRYICEQLGLAPELLTEFDVFEASAHARHPSLGPPSRPLPQPTPRKPAGRRKTRP